MLEHEMKKLDWDKRHTDAVMEMVKYASFDLESQIPDIGMLFYPNEN